MSSPIFWHFARQLVPWLVAIAVYLVVATVVVRWDMGRHGEPRDDFGADLYGMYTQLFFEPTQTLPHSALARAVFWITPVLGVALLLRGLLRVGSSLFDIEERRKLWVKIMSDRMKDHVIVCGLGHVGIRVVESLKALGVAIIAIEKRGVDSFAPDVERLGVPVIYGDARRDDLLLEAGVRVARSIVCATDDDLTNLELSIDARRENPKIRVVMRVFDQRVAGKVGAALDLDETFSTSALAGPIVALQAVEDGVVGVYRLSDGTLRVDMEVAAPKGLVGRTVSECEDAIDGRVVGLRRGDAALLRARHDTEIKEHDVLTLDLPAENIDRLKRSLA